MIEEVYHDYSSRQLHEVNMTKHLKRVDWRAVAITKIPEDAVHLWPDGTWCWHYELSEHAHMSDDYKVLLPDSSEYEEFFGE